MSRRPELALVALFSLAVAVAIFAGLRNAVGGAGGGTPSAYLAGPDGAKGVYEVLQRLGRPLERRRTPLYDLTRARRPPALLVVLDPPDDLTAAELEQVVQYVRSGGAVLAAGDGGGITRCTGWDAHTAFLKGDPTDSQPVEQPVSDLELPPVTAVLRPLDSLLSVQDLDTRRRVRRNLDRESGCSGLAVPERDTLLQTERGKAGHSPAALPGRRHGDPGGGPRVLSQPCLENHGRALLRPAAAHARHAGAGHLGRVPPGVRTRRIARGRGARLVGPNPRRLGAAAAGRGGPRGSRGGRGPIRTGALGDRSPAPFSARARRGARAEPPGRGRRRHRGGTDRGRTATASRAGGRAATRRAARLAQHARAGAADDARAGCRPPPATGRDPTRRCRARARGRPSLGGCVGGASPADDARRS